MKIFRTKQNDEPKEELPICDRCRFECKDGSETITVNEGEPIERTYTLCRECYRNIEMLLGRMVNSIVEHPEGICVPVLRKDAYEGIARCQTEEDWKYLAKFVMSIKDSKEHDDIGLIWTYAKPQEGEQDADNSQEHQ